MTEIIIRFENKKAQVYQRINNKETLIDECERPIDAFSKYASARFDTPINNPNLTLEEINQ